MEVGEKTVFERGFGIYFSDNIIHIPSRMKHILENNGFRFITINDLIEELYKCPSYYAKRFNMEKYEFYKALRELKNDYQTLL